MNEEQALVILMDYRKSINSQGFEPAREEMDEALGVAINSLRDCMSKKYVGHFTSAYDQTNRHE